MEMYHYTIGIKKRFFFKKYRNVIRNYYENVCNNAAFPLRMVLEFADGSTLSIGGINKADVKVYDDYKAAQEQAKHDKLFEEKRAEFEKARLAPQAQAAQETTSEIQQLAAARGLI